MSYGLRTKKGCFCIDLSTNRVIKIFNSFYFSLAKDAAKPSSKWFGFEYPFNGEIQNQIICSPGQPSMWPFDLSHTTVLKNSVFTKGRWQVDLDSSFGRRKRAFACEEEFSLDVSRFKLAILNWKTRECFRCMLYAFLLTVNALWFNKIHRALEEGGI